MHNTLRPELAAKCVEMLYSQASNAYTASIVAGVLVGALYWNLASRAVIVGWGVAYLAMIAIRHLLGVRYRMRLQTIDQSPAWLRYFRSPVFVCGALWGAFGVYLASHGDAYHLAALLLTLGALVSGAVTAYSIVISVFLAFCVPAMMPVGLYLISQGTYSQVALGLLVLAWMYFMYQGARRFRTFALESLGYQFENTALVRNLAEERDKAEELAIRLKALSSLDSLTGIANRRQFDDEMQAAFARASRDGNEVALILCDLDCFKLYNDTYGHPQGDECLRRAAALLAEHASRESAVAARFGGEEFAVVIPKTDRGAALALAMKIRAALEALGLPHESSKVGGKVVTGSFGVSSVVPGDGATIARLIECADQALYDAKGAGRNRAAYVPYTGAPAAA